MSLKTDTLGMVQCACGRYYSVDRVGYCKPCVDKLQEEAVLEVTRVRDPRPHNWQLTGCENNNLMKGDIMSYMKRHLEAVEGTRATERLEKLIEQHVQEWELTGSYNDDEWAQGVYNGLLKAINIMKNSEAL